MKTLIKKFIPKFLLLRYHKILSFLAAFYYGFPSRKMVIIGVTGTGGKSTVVNLIAKILEEGGFKVGLTSTANFKIGDKEWVNKTKMTMLGRFALQKMLKEMVSAGCQYAIIETSSEGIVQSRHINIDYDIVVFTNLSSEHIESHGSFENYKKAKGKLFEKLIKYKRKQLVINDQKVIVRKISIINIDDKNADYFLQFEADEKIGYGIKFPISNFQFPNRNFVKAEKILLIKEGSGFFVNDTEFNLKLLGEFNIYNALAGISVGLSQGLSLEIIKKALKKIEGMPGRLEQIDEGQSFRVIVDYAHTPDSLEKVYQIADSSWLKSPESKIISVLGSAGGGRDKSKRPVIGRLAAKYADYIIVTSEDPYDENPLEIIEQIAIGVKEDVQREERLNFWKILDRGEAIKKALILAKDNDIVLITGKGCEQCIMGSKGEKVPWDDRLVTQKILKSILNKGV